MTKAVVVISDTHIGSYQGLCPPAGLPLDHGAPIAQSKEQDYTWRCWLHFWGTFVPRATAGADQVVVVHNGDAIDGNHHEVVDVVPSVASQEAAAIDILRPIAKRWPLYMVRGTEAHEQKSGQSAERIASALDCPPDTRGNHARWFLLLEPEGVLTHIAHHIGTTKSTAYETSAPMRELVAGLTDSAQWGQAMPRVMVRSHRHRYVQVQIPGVQGGCKLVVTPGWQLKTPNVHKSDAVRVPTVGGIVLYYGEGGCQIKEMIYPMPQPAIVQL